MGEFDELNDNINNLIDELKNRDDKPDLSSLNDFVETTKNYDKHLSEIHINTKSINDTLNSYLKSINTLETGDVNTEIDHIPTVDNNVEQQSFTNYNEELKKLVERVGELSLQLSNMKTKVDLDIDLSVLDSLSTKIKEASITITDNITSVMQSNNFDINIKSDELLNEITLLSNKLKELEEPINLYFSSNLEEVKTLISELGTNKIDALNTDYLEKIIAELESKNINILDTTTFKEVIAELESKNINILDTTTFKDAIAELEQKKISILDTDNISTISNSIDTAITKLDSFKDMKLDVNITTNIEEIQTTLQELKDIKLDIIFNMDTMQTNVSDIQLALGDLKAELGIFTIEANVDIKTNVNDIKTKFDELVSNISILPKVNFDFDKVDFLPNIQDALNIDFNSPNKTGIELQADNNNVNSKIEDYFATNTNAINDLKNVISALADSQQKQQQVIKLQTEPSKENNNKNLVDTKKGEPSMTQMMKLLTDSINTMVSKQSQMITELKKSNFLSNKD
jgi:hypothetical protein